MFCWARLASLKTLAGAWVFLAAPAAILRGEEPSEPFPIGYGPQVPGVTWAQRGVGTRWSGSGRTASFFGTDIVIPINELAPPQPPAPWRSLEATVYGPGLFSFKWSEPIRSRGGREPDAAVCTLRVDGEVRNLNPWIADRQQVAIGPGRHTLLWTPDFGPPAFHQFGYPSFASFDLSDLSFTAAPLSVDEGLDAPAGQWQPVGSWTAGFAGDSAGRDAVWNETDRSLPGFTASVQGPGTLVLDGTLMISVQDTQLWRSALRPVSGLSEGSFQLTVNENPSQFLASSERHSIALPTGRHQLRLAVKTGVGNTSPPGSSNGDIFRSHIHTLQFVPEQPATFSAWLGARGLPADTDPHADPDGNGLSHWLEWGTGVADAAHPMTLNILHADGEIVLHSPRNSSAALQWIIDERQGDGSWLDVGDSFSIDLSDPTVWRARRGASHARGGIFQLRLPLGP